jgi:gluconate 2-dehydrogenase gamma chain
VNFVNHSRRQFLSKSGAGLTSAWLALRWPAILAVQQQAQSAADSGRLAKFQFFSPEQAVEVEAMTAQIIPSDNAPGAREARVIYFIDRVLLTLERDKQPAYRQGLKDLQQKTQELFPGSKVFSSLAPAQQIHLLTAIQKTDFFELVRFHTITGFLANPEYGGNYDQEGWKLIGFEDEMHFEPPFGYYDREENKAG